MKVPDGGDAIPTTLLPQQASVPSLCTPQVRNCPAASDGAPSASAGLTVPTHPLPTPATVRRSRSTTPARAVAALRWQWGIPRAAVIVGLLRLRFSRKGRGVFTVNAQVR